LQANRVKTNRIKGNRKETKEKNPSFYYALPMPCLWLALPMACLAYGLTCLWLALLACLMGIIRNFQKIQSCSFCSREFNQTMAKVGYD